MDNKWRKFLQKAENLKDLLFVCVIIGYIYQNVFVGALKLVRGREFPGAKGSVLNSDLQNPRLLEIGEISRK